MDTSFYTAVQGARAQQRHMDVISNNLANVNTEGYRRKSASFQELMYYNMHGTPGRTQPDMKAGAGAQVQRTETDFKSGSLIQTGGKLDYAVKGDGFFMLLDPADGGVSYTRAGKFTLSQRQDGMYLAASDGRLVLDSRQQPIPVSGGTPTAEPGVFEFVHTYGMLSAGDNSYIPSAGNGTPVAVEGRLMTGTLENSNVDLAEEMGKVVESSRSYSYMLKMVQTADEVEQTVNSLRG